MKLKTFVSKIKEESFKLELDKVSDLRHLLNSRKDRGDWDCLDDTCRFSNPSALAKCKKCSLPRLMQKSLGGDEEEERRSRSRDRSVSGGSPARRLPEVAGSLSGGSPFRRLADGMSSSTRDSPARRRAAEERSLSRDASPFRGRSVLSSQERRGSREPETENHRTSSDMEVVATSSRERGRSARRSLSSSASVERKQWSGRASSSSSERRSRSDSKSRGRVELRVERESSSEGSTSPPRRVRDPVSYEDFQDTLKHHMTKSSKLIRLNTSSGEKLAGPRSPRSSPEKSDSESGSGPVSRDLGRKYVNSDLEDDVSGGAIHRSQPSSGSAQRNGDSEDSSDGEEMEEANHLARTSQSRSLSRSSR